ncbi:Globin-like protein 26 [Caenorhabditis elegans]|uniref:Globin-like protein 26 n=1 Tax=Caenorhabditis elegans TaxID=6239 RepID=GLB26_CAEEL|nr:Globin-like protein 26 [Caenorhabditis elegans]Q22663.1 RecName: Full=Globin-like protein 26 [Caenorhabditis elegans]CAA99921.1 Globin-like protein 26 [Caenorhabditis elegans]|eukprot:NP_492188.1 Globin-like protein 26 [Caenorhabditis elegans]
MGSSTSTPAPPPKKNKPEGRKADNQILNSYQKSIVRNAWRHMSQKGPSNCGSTITRRMMARKSTIGDILDRSTLDYHNLQIVEFLQKVMQSLDEPDKISKLCQEIGQKHAKYRRSKGMKIDYWDKLGEAITETIREYQGWKIHRESLRAATVLVSYVVDQLRFGYSRGLHVQGSRETKEDDEE